MRWSCRLATLAGLLFFCSGAGNAQGCEPPKWNLPSEFPIDAFVLSVLVDDPAAEAGGAPPLLRTRLNRAVHVPEHRGTFDFEVRASAAGCPGDSLTSEALRELYARGDELLIVAFPGPGGTLETFVDWIAYAAQLRTQLIESPFDYLSSLFRLESLQEDTDRIQPLRSMAVYVDDPEVYRELLNAQLLSKRLRKRMMSVHGFLRDDEP